MTTRDPKRVEKDDPSWVRQENYMAEVVENLTKALDKARSIHNQFKARSLPYEEDARDAHQHARLATNELDMIGVMIYSMNGNRGHRRPRVVPPLPSDQGGASWDALRSAASARGLPDTNWYESDDLTKRTFVVEQRVDEDTVLTCKDESINLAAADVLTALRKLLP